MYSRFKRKRDGVDFVFTADNNQETQKSEATLEFRWWGDRVPPNFKIQGMNSFVAVFVTLSIFVFMKVPSGSDFCRLPKSCFLSIL